MSKSQLERGYRLVELLKQGLNSPMSVDEQVVSIFAGTTGRLDDIHVTDVRRFEAELLDFMRSQRSDVVGSIDSAGALDEGALEAAVVAFKSRFQSSDGAGDEELKSADGGAMAAAAHDDMEGMNG